MILIGTPRVESGCREERGCWAWALTELERTQWTGREKRGINNDSHASWSPSWMEVSVSDSGGVAGESKLPQVWEKVKRFILPGPSSSCPTHDSVSTEPSAVCPQSIARTCTLCAHHPSLRQRLICATRMTRTPGQVLGHRGDRINPASALPSYQSERRLTHQTHRSNSRCPRPSRNPLAAVLLVSIIRVLITSVLQCGESKSRRD